MVFIIIWTLIVVALMFATIACAVVCLVIKGPKRIMAVDVLLALATSTCVLVLAAELFPKGWLNNGQQATDATQLEYHRKIELFSVGLKKSDMLEQLTDPIKSLALFEGYRPVLRNREEAEKFLHSELLKHPKDAGLVARYMILMKTQGKKTTDIVTRYETEGGENNELLSLLDGSYNYGNCDSEVEAFKIIDRNLSSGWFRDQAITTVVPESSPLVKSVQNARKNALTSWIQRFSITWALRLIFSVVGVFALYRWLKAPSANNAPELISYGFRKSYGCLLTVFCSQVFVTMISGFLIGIYTGIKSAMEHKPPELGNFAPFFSIANAVAIVISTTLSVDFFVCKPAGISLWKDFWLRSKVNSRTLFRTAGSAFCISILLNIITNLVMSQILHGYSSNSGAEAHLQLIDAAVSGNILWLLAWSILYCGIAPVSEEMIFRGLLYSWLRERRGVIFAVITSAVIFAAFHLNLATFPQLFVLGIIFAWVYERTRSLPTVALVHAVWNLWIILSVVLQGPC